MSEPQKISSWDEIDAPQKVSSWDEVDNDVKKKDVTTPTPKPLQQNGLRSGLVSPLNLNGQSYYRAPLVAPIENTNLGIDVGGMVQKSVTPKTNTTDEVPLLSNQPQRQQVSAQNKSDNLNPAPSVQAQAQILGLKSQTELNADEQSKQLAEYLNVNGKDLNTFDPIEFKKALGKVNGEEERKHFIGADMHSYQSDVDAYNKVGSILERNIALAKADIDAKYGAGAFARYQKQKTSFDAELEGKLPQIDAIDAQLKELTERKPRTVQEFQANKQLLAQLEQQRKDIVAPLQQVQEKIQQAEQQTEFQKLKYLGEAQKGLTVKQQSLLDKYPSAKATLQSNEKLQSWIDNASKKLSATAKSGGTGVGDVPLVLLGDALKTVTGLAHKLSSIPQTVEKAFGVQDNVFLTPFNFATGLINDATAIVDDKAKNLIPTNLQLPISQKYKLVDGNKIFLDKNDKPTFVRDADGYKVDPKQEQLVIEQYNQMPNKSKIKTEDNTDWGVALNDATKFGMDIVAMGQMGRGLSVLGLAGTPAKTWANGTLTLMGYGLNDAYEGAKQSAPNLTDQQAAQYALGSQTAIGAIFGLLGGAKMKYITGEGGESVFSKVKDYLSKNNAFKLTVEDIKAIDGGASAFQVGKAKIQKAIGEGLLQGGEMGIIMPSITAVANNVTNTMVGYDALDGNLVIDKESLTNSALPAILVGIVTGGMSVNGSTLKNQAWGNINKNEQTVNSTIEFLDKSVEDGLYTPTQAYNIKERIKYTQENIKPLDGSLNAVEHKALSNLYDNKFQLQKQADKFTDSGAKKAYTDKIRDIDNDIAQIINKKEDFKSNITTSVMDNGVKENEVVKPVADVNIQQEEVKVNQVEVPLDIVDESVQKPASEMDEQQVNQLYEEKIANPTVEEEQNPFLDKLRKKKQNEAEITPNELIEQGGVENVGEGLQGEYQNNQGVQQGSGIGQVGGQEVPTEKVEEGASNSEYINRFKEERNKIESELDNPPTEFKDSNGMSIDKKDWIKSKVSDLRYYNNRIGELESEDALNPKPEVSKPVSEVAEKGEGKSADVMPTNAWGSKEGIDNNFYTKNENGFAVKIPLDRVENVNIDGIDFHVSKVDGDWKVIEKNSGLEVSTGKLSNTKKSAIEDATYRINNNGGGSNISSLSERAIKQFTDSNLKLIEAPISKTETTKEGSGVGGDVMPKEVSDLYSEAASLRFTLNALKQQMRGRELVGKSKAEYESTKTRLDNIELKLSEYEKSKSQGKPKAEEVKKEKAVETKQTFEAGDEANYYDDLFDKTDKVKILYKTGDGENGTERYQVKFENGQEASIWSDKLQSLKETPKAETTTPKGNTSNVGVEAGSVGVGGDVVDEKVVKSRVKRIAKSLNVDEQRSQQIHDIALKAKDYEDFKKQVGDLIGDNTVNENRVAETYTDIREEAKSEYEKELERNLEDLRASYGEAQRADTGLKKITEKSPTSVRNFINRILNGTTPETVAQAKARLVEMQRKYRKEKADMRALLPRERGVNFVIEKLSKAARNGDISQEGADLAIDLIRKQPNMFEDLAISITKGDKGLNGDGVQGWYRAADALIKIFKNPKDPLTATHEILHHTERFLPQDVRDGITQEWHKQIQRQTADIAKRLKTETDVDTRQQLTQGLLYLSLAEARQIETNSANVEAMERIMSKYLGDHTDSKGNFHKGLGDSWYQLYNPSEWWAVNASKIFRDAQNKPELKTWVDKAKAFYNYLIDSAKKIFKGNPTANVEKGLRTILKGEALEDREGTMLSQSKRLLNIKQKGSFEDRLKSIYDEVNKGKAVEQSLIEQPQAETQKKVEQVSVTQKNKQPTISKTETTENPALKDVESTDKALEGVDTFHLVENEGEWKATTKTYRGREIGNWAISNLDKKQQKEYLKIRDEADTYGTKEQAEENLKKLKDFEQKNKEAFERAKQEIDALKEAEERKAEERKKQQNIFDQTEQELNKLSDKEFDKLVELIDEKRRQALEQRFGDRVEKRTLFITPISESYHKAKADGSNPELVKAVEEALTPLTENTKSNEEQPTNSEKGKKAETVAEISPNKNVSASKASAIKDLIAEKYSDLKEMEAGILANLDGTELVEDLLDDNGKPKGLKGSAVKKLVDSGYVKELEFNDDVAILTDKGKKFQEALKARQETRKGIKAGTDLFPKDAGLKGKELVGDALDRIASKIGSKKNLTEQERTSLTKDISDLAKGLIQMGSATLDNVIDKIKEAIKKRVPELSDKEVDALAENIEDKVLLGEAVNWYKDKGYTYEQAKAELDKSNVDYNEQDLSDVFNGKTEPQELIGTKNAMTEQEMERMGITPPEKLKSKPYQEQIKVAREGIDNGTVDPYTIVDDILSTENIEDTAIKPSYEPALQLHLVDLKNKVNVANDRIIEIEKQLQKEPDNLELQGEISDLNAQIIQAETDREQALMAAQKAGTVWGNYGQNRQNVIDLQDIVQAKINRIKALYNGEPPKEVKEKLESLQRENDRLEAENRRIIKEFNESQQQQDIAEFQKQLQQEYERGLVEGGNKASYQKRAKSIADSVRKLKTKPPVLKDANGNEIKITQNALFPTASWNDAVEILAKSIETAGTFADGLANGIEKVKKHLESYGWYSKLSDKDKESVVGLVKDSISAKDEQNKRLKIPRGYLKDIIESKGITDINKLVEEVKNDYPDKSDREIRDAITGYGVTSEPSSEPVDVALRKMNRKGRILSALEDLDEGIRPDRSGAKRDVLEDDERADLKKIRDGIKELPQSDEDLSKKMKSAQDAIETRIKNRIADIKLILDGKAKDTKSNKVEDTEDITKLREEKEQWEQKLVDFKAKNKQSDALDAIQKLADKNGSTTVSKEMVTNGHIKDVITSQIQDGVPLKDIAENTVNLLKPILPDITQKDVTDALLKKGNFATEKTTKKDLQIQLSDLKAQLNLKEKIANLENGIIQKTKEKGATSDKVKELQIQLSDLKAQLNLKEKIANLENGIIQKTKEKGATSDKVKELLKQLSDLKAQLNLKEKIANLENGIIQKTKEKGATSDKVKELQKQLAETKQRAKNGFANISSAELERQIKATQNKIDKGEYFKIPVDKKTFENDKQWLENKKRLDDIKKKLNILEQNARESKKTTAMIIADVVTQNIGRRLVFFGSQAYQVKLSVAAFTTLLTKLPKEVLGQVFTTMFPKIGKDAQIEGSFDLGAVGKFYREALNPLKLAKGTANIALTGKNTLDQTLETHPERQYTLAKLRDDYNADYAWYAKYPKIVASIMSSNHIPGLDLLTTDPHVMIKDPIKRGSYEFAFMKIMNHYKSLGMELNNPLLIGMAQDAAFRYAKAEIFMGSGLDKSGKRKDPSFTDKINAYFNSIENSAIEEANKKGGNQVSAHSKYALVKLYNFLYPVVGVPSRILGTVVKSNPISFSKDLMSAAIINRKVTKGIESLSNNQADMIIRQLKEGAIGSAMWTLGFVATMNMLKKQDEERKKNKLKLGGYYTGYIDKKDRIRENLLQPNDFIINNDGHDKYLTHNAQHSTAVMAIQAGATLATLFYHFNNPHLDYKAIETDGVKRYQRVIAQDDKASSVKKATVGLAGSLADQHPIVQTSYDIYESTQTDKGREAYIRNIKNRLDVKKKAQKLKDGILDLNFFEDTPGH